MKNTPLRIVHITDMHLYADKDRDLLGVKTRDSYHALLDLLRKDKVSPDMFILGGDLSQDTTEESYHQLADSLSEWKVPVYYVPGNHDDYAMMQRVYPRGMLDAQKHIVLEHWQLILLNSQIPKCVEGNLDAEQLEFMEACLQKHPNLPALITFHHQPVPVNCAWLDNLGVKNADEFWQIIAKYPNVDTVLFGHVHQESMGIKNGIKYFSTPSTCIQFKTNSDPFALEELPPAYRIIDLYPNRKLTTQVHRTDHYVGIFDAQAKGY